MFLRNSWNVNTKRLIDASFESTNIIIVVIVRLTNKCLSRALISFRLIRFYMSIIM